MKTEMEMGLAVGYVITGAGDIDDNAPPEI